MQLSQYQAVPGEKQSNDMDLIAAIATIIGAISGALAIYDWIEQRRKKPK